jgi:hypothetical protein
MQNKPPYRFGTVKAMKELADELRLPYTSDMQDWSYEVAEPDQIDNYLHHYDQQTDDDKKFVLMEMILQATEDQGNHSDQEMYWRKASQRLSKDFELHRFTIFYWSCFDKEDLSESWTLAPNMRELWQQITGEHSNEAFYSKEYDKYFTHLEVDQQATSGEQTLIDSVKETLQRYPELVIEHLEPNELVIRNEEETGFFIALETSDKEHTLYLDDWHMHYNIGDEDEILQLIVDALIGMLRLEVHSKNGYDYKWVLQQRDAKDQWQNKGTTAILNLRFWIKPEIRYLQNSCIFKS